MGQLPKFNTDNEDLILPGMHQRGNQMFATVVLFTKEKKFAYNSKTLKIPRLSLFYTEETRPKNLIEKISPFVLV